VLGRGPGWVGATGGGLDSFGGAGLGAGAPASLRNRFMVKIQLDVDWMGRMSLSTDHRVVRIRRVGNWRRRRSREESRNDHSDAIPRNMSQIRHGIYATILLVQHEESARWEIMRKVGDQQTIFLRLEYRNRNRDQELQEYPQDPRSASWRHRSFLRAQINVSRSRRWNPREIVPMNLQPSSLTW
jgi:hypothetical protein